ncbi:Pectin lyase-like superfamily protein [Zea mays]|uniref:Pectin lyase-like superfamily protein n=1 Tax=Zea mays TaxID=4577 RepID=A0A1D6LRE4_MAIZE|nr:Pectin lyase-like superfamily protein [Zea mays]
MGISVWRHWEADNPYTQGRLPCRTTQLHRPVQGRRDHLGGWQSASDHIPKPVQDPLRECQDGGLDQPHLHRHDVLPQQVVYCQRRLQGHRQGRHLQEHHRHLLHPGGHQPALHCQDPMHRRHHGRRQRRV